MPEFIGGGGFDPDVLMQRLEGHLSDYSIDLETSRQLRLFHQPIGPPVAHTDLPYTYYGTPATVAQVKFDASEWYRFPVNLPPMESYRDYVTNEWENRTQLGLAARLYHGCPFGAFLGMLFIGGFIAGPNPCK